MAVAGFQVLHILGPAMSTAPALVVHPGVRAALEAGRPVVALESSVISHGLPWPENLELARDMEATVRAGGAEPATIALLGGRVHVGLGDGDLEHLARTSGVWKVSRRDLPVAIAQKRDGATTVAATMIAACWAGIRVMATGGIGGVHRGEGADVSADLPELARTPVLVVCAGAKAILDLPATLEWLETWGVPVVGYGTSEFPAFYSRAEPGRPFERRGVGRAPRALPAVRMAAPRSEGRAEAAAGGAHEAPPEAVRPGSRGARRAATRRASSSRPRWSRDLTVPTGTSSDAAVSSRLQPWRSKSRTAQAVSSGSSSRHE